MRKIFIAFLLVLSISSKSYGNACMACSNSSPYVPGCAMAYSLGCIGSVEISTCLECLPGYSLEPGITQCSQTLNICVEDTGGCVCDCPGDVNWTAYGTGYQVYTEYLCNNTTCACDSLYSYRCAAGYYGSSINGHTGCTVCPNGGTSVAGSNTSITGCFYPASYSSSDSLGNYTYTQACYYSL